MTTFSQNLMDGSPKMNSPLRVLHLITSLDQGGAEAMLSALVADPRDGVDHQVCTMMAGEPFFEIDRTTLHIGPSQRGQFTLDLVAHIRRTLVRLRPHVLHSWMYHANLASLLALESGAEIIWSVHNTHLRAGESKVTTRLLNRLCAALSHRVPARIVYVAEAARRLHEAQGYIRSRGLVVPNGVDLNRFSGSSVIPDARIAPAPERRVLGIVGRFEPGKGQAFLIDVVAAEARLRESLHLVFVGRGCTSNQMRNHLSTAGLSAHATLLEAQPEVERIYAACDAIALPSFGEAFPMTAIEAAAMGKPIAASRVGDVPLLGLPEAHLFEPGDPAGCTRALHAVLASPDSHAASLRALAERFGIGSIRRRYADLYRMVARSTNQCEFVSLP